MIAGRPAQPKTHRLAPPPNYQTMSFHELLIALCAERGVGLEHYADLTGEDLEAVKTNNKAMEQMFEAITELHNKMSKAAAPKAVPAKKAPAAKKKAADDEDEEAPKTRTKKAAAPKEKGDTAKKAPSKYAQFTAAITKANKGQTEGWADVTVTVSLEKVTDSGKALLEHEAGQAFQELKGKEMTMEDLLKAAQELLTAVEGKVHPFKLSGLMWAAVGNVNPLVEA